MNRQSWKYLLIGAVMTVALSSTAPQADAHWWSYYQPVVWGQAYGWGAGCGYGCGAGYGSGGYLVSYSPTYSGCTACWSGCNGCWNDGSWYLGWRPGPVRRLFFGRYRWYYGNSCWGAYCSPCSVCMSDTCGGCTGCSDCTDGSSATPATPAAPTPAKKPAAEPAMPTEPSPVPPEPADQKTSGTTAEDSGVLTVWVPFDAKVTVNGLETRSTGSRRQFVSYGLKPGFSYKYEVRAEVVRDGKVQEETQTVTLTAGQISAVAFGFNTPAQQVAAR